MNQIEISREKLRLTEEISKLAKQKRNAEYNLNRIIEEHRSAIRAIKILEQTPIVYFDLKNHEEFLDRLTYTRFGFYPVIFNA